MKQRSLLRLDERAVEPTSTSNCSHGGEQPTICQWPSSGKILMQCPVIPDDMRIRLLQLIYWSCKGLPTGNFCIPPNKLSHCAKVLIAPDSRYTCLRLQSRVSGISRGAPSSLLKPTPATVHLTHHCPPPPPYLKCPFFLRPKNRLHPQHVMYLFIWGD